MTTWVDWVVGVGIGLLIGWGIGAAADAVWGLTKLIRSAWRSK